ncbi:MAG: hypothetical protein IPI37_05510 [Bacteroidales bacterium]|nr:hypothetical protein [Bacteroidales bacterium]
MVCSEYLVGLPACPRGGGGAVSLLVFLKNLPPVRRWQWADILVCSQELCGRLVFCQKPASLFAAAATECAVNILVCSQEPAGLFIRDGGRVRGESPCLLPKTCQPASQHNNTKYATLRYNFIPNPPEQDAMTI